MFKELIQVERFFTNRQSLGIKPGLERMRYLLKLVGSPESDLNAIHIAGTNGKGSTVQFIKRALRENGYNVGVFTSPSFTGLLGHIQKNEAAISSEEFLDIINGLYPFILKMDEQQNGPTEFEILTVVAFLYFQKEKDLHVTIIEAGMGGREDTTNCITPILSIITNIALDHTAFLGTTPTAVAYHKAGIIKKQRPVILGTVSQTVEDVIKKEALNKDACLFQIGTHFTYEQITQKYNEQSFIWSGGEHAFKTDIQLAGEHQAHNASLALMALEILEHKGFSMNWKKNIEGLKTTTIEGRFETIHNHPTIILDGAHNPASIRAFLHTVAMRPTKERQVIFAAFKDKAIDQMLLDLYEWFPSLVVTTFPHPRAAGKDEYAQSNFTFVEDWQWLLNEIIKETSEKEYYITGSLHFISLARKYISQAKNQ
ncbi:bifunctional folylpolyglutamate synthase/dihydrofolate synthase [Virgibacillus sp. W0430]|uniref:bifunctional folylpolyglutamate synthase/dihydrofolate synthase n=1 Tax=Virgibacillus sp. W0430 TaxID=3391580 RepID=UPI003F47EAA4